MNNREHSIRAGHSIKKKLAEATVALNDAKSLADLAGLRLEVRGQDHSLADRIQTLEEQVNALLQLWCHRQAVAINDYLASPETFDANSIEQFDPCM